MIIAKDGSMDLRAVCTAVLNGCVDRMAARMHRHMDGRMHGLESSMDDSEFRKIARWWQCG